MEVAKMSEKESKKKARRYTAAQKKEVVESAKSVDDWISDDWSFAFSSIILPLNG